MAPTALVLQWRKDTETGDVQAALAWHLLATAYLNGAEGLAKNTKLAVKMYLKAAELGYCGAMTALGSLYCNHAYMMRDDALALRWCRKAAEVTCRCEVGHSMDQYFFATCLLTGRACEQDLPLALHWYRVAATAGQREAQYSLGELYFHGLHVKRNIKLAVSWCAKSAEQGCGLAIYRMGKCHRDGVGVRQDNALAMV